jgi:hypothetical protein
VPASGLHGVVLRIVEHLLGQTNLWNVRGKAIAS